MAISGRYVVVHSIETADVLYKLKHLSRSSRIGKRHGPNTAAQQVAIPSATNCPEMAMRNSCDVSLDLDKHQSGRYIMIGQDVIVCTEAECYSQPAQSQRAEGEQKPQRQSRY